MVWEELKEDLIFTDVEAETTDDIFRQLGGALTEKGYTKDSYVQALIDREEEYPTGLNIDGIGVAIPHTPIEHVNKAATCIGILKKPVEFIEMGSDDDKVDVQLVFMLAVVDPSAHIDQLQRIVTIIQDKNVLKQLSETSNPRDIIGIIHMKEDAIDEVVHDLEGQIA